MNERRPGGCLGRIIERVWWQLGGADRYNRKQVERSLEALSTGNYPRVSSPPVEEILASLPGHGNNKET